MKLIKLFIFLNILLIPLSSWADCREERVPGSESYKLICTLDNPLGNNVDVNVFIGQIIYGIMGIVGSLALAMFIYGGLVWMTAAGSPEKVTKGKNILIWATIGIVVIFSAYTIVRFIITSIEGEPAATTPTTETTGR